MFQTMKILEAYRLAKGLNPLRIRECFRPKRPDAYANMYVS